jgi:cation diffusion facilitator family transporter
VTSQYERDSTQVRRVSVTGAIINLSLAIAKAIGGILFHSQALIADAVDSTSDLFTDAVTIAAIRFSRRPVDTNHPYGHGRFESLASLVVAVVLFFVAFPLIFQAFRSFLSGPSVEVGWPAAIIAGVSVLTKEWLFRWTRKAARKTHSPALLANAYHHRSDAFSSVTVLLGVLGSVFIPGAWFLDSVASLAVSGFIIHMGIRIATQAVHELTDMEQNPRLVTKLEQLSLTIPEVIDAHRIRTRRYGSLLYVDMDIEVSPEMTVHEAHEVAHDAKDLILETYDFIADALIHIEPEGSHHDGEGPVRGQ